MALIYFGCSYSPSRVAGRSLHLDEPQECPKVSKMFLVNKHFEGKGRCSFLGFNSYLSKMHGLLNDGCVWIRMLLKAS